MTDKEAMENVPEKVMGAIINTLVDENLMYHAAASRWVDTHAVMLLKNKDGSYTARIIRA